MAEMIEIGQVYRDTDNDGVSRNKRTIRILAREPDGRWLAETLTDPAGRPCFHRKTRLKEATIRGGYELDAILSEDDSAKEGDGE